jgi:hypothetical protein
MKLIACIYRRAHLWRTQISDKQSDEIRVYMWVVPVQYYCKSGTRVETTVQRDGRCTCNTTLWRVRGAILHRKQQDIMYVVAELLSASLM